MKKEEFYRYLEEWVGKLAFTAVLGKVNLDLIEYFHGDEGITFTFNNPTLQYDITFTIRALAHNMPDIITQEYLNETVGNRPSLNFNPKPDQTAIPTQKVPGNYL